MRKNIFNKKFTALFAAILMGAAVFLTACIPAQPPEVKNTIQFESNGGSEVASITVPAGTAVTEPSAPEFRFYEFGGWYSDEELTHLFVFDKMPEAELTVVYAKWTPVEAGRILFESNGGAAVAPMVEPAGAAVTQPANPVKEHYTFAGWYTDKNLTGNAYVFSTMPGGNLTLYAKWEVSATAAEVVFRINGEVYQTAVVQKGNAVAQPDESEILRKLGESEGYVLSAWENNGTAYNFTAPVQSGLTLDLQYHSPVTLADGGTKVSGYDGSGKVIVLPKEVTVIGDNAFARNQNITAVYATGAITAIGKNAFYNCNKLADFTIPATVTSIGDFAFYNCAALKNITLPTGLTKISNGAFAGCYSLFSINIPENVTEIGASAFANCTRLNSAVLPSKIQKIGDQAFRNCRVLGSLTLPKDLAELGSQVIAETGIRDIAVETGNVSFVNDDGVLYGLNGGEKTRLIFYSPNRAAESFTVPESIRTVDPGAFNTNKLKKLQLQWQPAQETDSFFGSLSGCPSLEELTLPDLNVSNGYLSFLFGASQSVNNGINSNYVPASLKTVIFTDITVVPEYAFYGCSGLNEIKGIDNLTRVEEYAFAYTRCLTEFVFNKDLEFVGDCAFLACPLFEIRFDNANPYFDLDKNVLYHKGSSTLLMSLDFVSETVDIREGTEKIAPYAFKGCALKRLVIPESVVEIGEGALENCMALEDITLPFIGKNLQADAADAKWESVHTLSFIFGGAHAAMDFEKVPELKNVTVTQSNPVSISYEKADKTVKEINNRPGVPHYAFCMVSVTGTITLPQDVEIFGNFSFTLALTAPVSDAQDGKFDSLCAIGQYAFGFSAVEIFDLPDTLEIIGIQAFEESAITQVVIPGNVEEVPLKAFFNCAGLGTLTLKEGVKVIDNSAFGFTSTTSTVEQPERKLKSLVLPKSLVSVGDSAFNNNWELKTIEHADLANSSLRLIGSYAFGAVKAMESFIIPKTVETIKYAAFQNCESLKTVTFDDIENSRFGFGSDTESGILSGFAATALTSMILPYGTKVIDSNAFAECKALKEVTVGFAARSADCALEEVRRQAFRGCTGLTKLTLYQTNIMTNISNNLFDFDQIYPQGFKICVPESVVDAFILANAFNNKAAGTITVI